MKVVAQSMVPARVPYIHLGYTAATISNPFHPPQLIGLVLILSGLLLAFRITSKRARLLTHYHFQLRNWPLVGAGLIVMCLGCLLYGAFPSEEVYAYPEFFTRTQLRRLDTAIRQRLAESQRPDGRPLPEDTEKLVKSLREYLPNAGAFLDGWKRPVRITQMRDGPEPTYKLTSAGPDGTFDTADDINSDITTPMDATSAQ